MSVLVDTSIWSLAFRRERHELDDKQRWLLAKWLSLVGAGEAMLMGPIRQEILSGIRSQTMFESLREWLRFFDVLEVSVDDYDRAAAFYNRLRDNGLTGSPTDLLICSVAHRYAMPIFTTDNDFIQFADHLPIELYMH